jgi:hypothetical protein
MRGKLDITLEDILTFLFDEALKSFQLKREYEPFKLLFKRSSPR